MGPVLVVAAGVLLAIAATLLLGPSSEDKDARVDPKLPQIPDDVQARIDATLPQSQATARWLANRQDLVK